MRRAGAVLVTEFLYVARDRMALVMLFLMPLIFTAILALAFGGAGNTPLRVGLVGGDPDFTRDIALTLEREKGLAFQPLSLGEAELGIRRGSLDAALIVPQQIDGSSAVSVMTDPSTQRGYDAYTRLMGVQAALTGKVTAVALAGLVLPEEQIAAAASRYDRVPVPAVRVVRSWKTVAEGVLQVSPGMLVMFILMFAAYSGEGIVFERVSGTLRRLLATPTSAWQYVAGRLAGKVALGMVQFVFLAAFGAAVYAVNWGSLPGLMLFTALIFTFTCAAFGLCLGVACRTPEQLSAVATTACLALAALGGTWWPLEATPPALQVLGRALPTGQAMKAFHALILFGPEGVAAAREAWFGLGAWGVLFLILGVLLFRSAWRGGGRRPAATENRPA